MGVGLTLTDMFPETPDNVCLQNTTKGDTLKEPLHIDVTARDYRCDRLGHDAKRGQIDFVPTNQKDTRAFYLKRSKRFYTRINILLVLTSLQRLLTTFRMQPI